jgi:AraC-like DNA-binding protein/ligand-binding sensor protein
MNTIDLFLDEKVKSLIDSFSYCFKVPITIFSADLKDELVMGFYSMSDYCSLIWKHLHYEGRCRELDLKMCLRSLNNAASRAPQFYVCHAGMVDAAVPITLGNVEKDGRDLAGYAMIGQIRTRDAFIPNEIRQKWRQKGLDPELLQNAFNGQPFFEKEALENMLNLFSMLCDFIVSKGYIKSRRLDIASEAIRWVEKRVSGPLVFSELAKHLGYSQNTILNALKKRLNMTFRQLCTLKRIERFERVVSENPSITIEEAALKAGFNDASYFSRVYKKARSATPSAFIKSARQGGEFR